ncbi:TetR/AcrR family transcriptional regulator [Viridibacillus sp. YIM B01967]|uniref:TetR/AcrR family transcriptional regulator n=1 Tax=Viridibacillus soli TaxID=2798301 RepID=A0ABS1H723_9BACL|nr:TetR/AcrR family transcriptional regulator [Viridibacillus soli]MBK3495195.1 TetR/AcrR family transcriptional regulator [Viridibacillus soli]
MSPRKQSSQELTREMIIHEARTKFVEEGFHQVSMRSIAKELDCSHGAIYYHFKNKAELFYVVLQEYFLELNGIIDEVVINREENCTKLYKLFISFIEFGLNNQSQYESMFMLRNSEIDVLSQEAANFSYQKFAQAVQTLSNNTLLIKDIYAVFISLHGFVVFYRGYATCFEEVKDAAYAHVDFLIKSLSSEKISRSNL